jgi:hypothetical protein
MRSPRCLCVCGSHHINFQMTEPVFLKLDMYIMAPEPLPTVYFINPSHQSLRLHVYPFLVARQQLDKNVTAAVGYIRNNRRIVGRVVLYAVRVVSK